MENLIINNVSHSHLYKGSELMWSKPIYIIYSGDSSIWVNGTGTVLDPYLIESPAHLAYLSQQVATDYNVVKDKVFKQMIDIDLNNIPWRPIGGRDISGNNSTTNTATFTYDGNNKKIKNLTINSDNGNHFGLFGLCWYLNLKNLKLVNVTANIPTKNVGGFAGAITTNSIIENCHVLGVSNIIGNYGGGISSYMQQGSDANNRVTIRNCSVGRNTTIEGKSYAGGINAYATNYILIEQCVNYATVFSTKASNSGVGGIFSSCGTAFNGIVTKCSNFGTITAVETSGGIGAYFRNGTMSYCVNVGSITGGYPAGIIGFPNTNSVVVNNCANLGTITCNNVDGGSGGIIAITAIGITLNNCYNKGNITSIAPTGGILGQDYSTSQITINNVYNTGIINSTAALTGSIVGSFNTTLFTLTNLINASDICEYTSVGDPASQGLYNELHMPYEQMLGSQLSVYLPNSDWEFNDGKTPKIKLI